MRKAPPGIQTISLVTSSSSLLSLRSISGVSIPISPCTPALHSLCLIVGPDILVRRRDGDTLSSHTIVPGKIGPLAVGSVLEWDLRSPAARSIADSYRPRARAAA